MTNYFEFVLLDLYIFRNIVIFIFTDEIQLIFATNYTVYPT